MQLEKLNISKKLSGNYFYFAADSRYFDLYGKALALSLKKNATWSLIHVHLYNPTPEQENWCSCKDISYTQERIDANHPEFRTLCACIRFIRIPEIFKNEARIISFDCDVIANNNIPLSLFLSDTDKSKVTLKKGGKALASSVSFGLDNFRHEYSKRLIENFEKDNIFWFLDQVLLDELVGEGYLDVLRPDWSNTKMLPDRMIWTAKGARKENKPQYIELVNQYNSLK